MAKKIRIIPWLDEVELNKQLKRIGNRKQKVKVDIDSNSINKATNNMRQLSNATKESTTFFGKLKTAINNTFSPGHMGMTSYLLVLNEINKAGKQAKQTIVDMNNAVTDLSVAMNSSRNEASEYLKVLNQQAIELKSTTKSVSDAADSWLRQGKSIAETETLIKDSLVLSKVGKIDSASATNYLTSALNGYKLEAKDAISVIDQLTSVDAVSASEAGGLALSMSRTASAADMAGVSMSKLIGWLATVKETSRATDETVGNMMKTMLSRMNQVKVGKFIDSETGESLNDMERVLKEVGISMRDLDGQFKSSELVLDELGKKYNEFDTITQRAVATQLGGAYQYEKVIALLSNYSKALNYAEVAEQSAGSAMQKFNASYMNSLEAKQNALQASFESMIMNSDFEQVYAGIISATSALVEFMDKTNSLKGIFSGLMAAGAIKLFLSLRTGINQAYISLNQFQNAMYIVRSTDFLNNDFDRLLVLTKNLSASQTKLLLSTKTLTVAQREQILVNQGMTRAEAQLKLQVWGLSTAENGLSASTISLSNAVRGLWATLIANPLVLVTALVSGGVMAWQSYKQAVEETIRANIESANSASEQISKVEDLYVQYEKLASKTERTSSEEESFKSILEDITKTLGGKEEALKSLTAGTAEYTETLKEATKAEIENQNVAITVGRKSAEDKLLDTVWSNLSGSKISIPLEFKMEGSEQQAFESVENTLNEFKDRNRNGIEWKPVNFDLDHKNIDNLVEYYGHLVEAQKELVLQSKETGNEELLNTDIYKNIDNVINRMSDSVKKLTEIRYGELKADYLIQNQVPTTIQAYENMERAILSAGNTGEYFQQVFKDMLSQDYSNLLSMEETDPANSIFSWTEGLNKQIDSVQENINKLSSALESLNTGKLDTSDVLDLIQNFPQLNSYVDMSKDNFGNLKDGLEQLIQTQPTELIKSLREMEAASEEDRTAIDNLISSFEVLSNLTIDYSNFDIMTSGLNNIESATSSLVSAMEQLKDGTALTKSELANLALEYPHLLDASNLFTDGSVEGQQNMINSILDMYEQQYDGILEEKIAELEATNECLQAQIDLECQKMNKVLEIEALQDTGKLETEQQFQTKLNELRDLEGQNYVAFENGKLQVSAESLSKQLQQENDKGKQSEPIWQAQQELITDAYVKGGEGGLVALNTLGSRINLWVGSVASRFKALANTIANALSGKEVEDSGNIGSVDTGIGSTIGKTTYKNQGSLSIGDKSVSDWLSEYKENNQAIVESLEKEIDTNNIRIGNLESLKGLDLQDVSSSKSGGGSKSKSPKSEEMKVLDGIKRKVDLLKESYEELNKEASNSDNSYATQLNFLNAAIAKQEDLIALEKEAANVYKLQWETKSAGLSDDVKNTIMQGSMDIEQYSGTQYDSISDALSAWDTYKEMLDSVKSDEREIADAQRDHFQKQVDWDKQEIDNLKDKSDIAQTSYEDQIDYINQALTKSDELSNKLSKKANQATEKWLEAKKVIESIDVAKILRGELNISDYTDEDYIQRLLNAQDAYDGYEDAEEQLNEQVKSNAELQKEAYDKAIEYIESQQNLLSSTNSTIQSDIDLIKEMGSVVTADLYNDMISNNKDLMDLYKEQRAEAEDYLSELDTDSPEYYDVLAQIESCNQAIIQCKAEQAKWNEEIKRLPVERLSKYLAMLGYIKQDLQNFIDEQSSLDITTTKDQYQGLIDISQKQIDKLLEQQDKLKDLLKEYQYGSDKFNDVSGEIQDIDDEISSLIQSQNEWNKSILEIPVNNLTKVNEQLQNISNALGDTISEFDTAISAVTGVIDKQVQSINDLKDATSDEYENKIKPLQEELDLLKEKTEQENLQLAIEEAQADLEKAKQNTNNKVLFNGEWEYRADIDEMKNAQEALDDAVYNKKVNDLEKQIDGLEEERDKLLEGYDEQIEKLDKIKDRWSSIASDIKLAADSLKANDLLGAGWENKVLTGNDDDIYNAMKDMYSSIYNQKEEYDKQIKATEQIADLMGQYVKHWLNGAVTYDQTMDAITLLVEKLQDGFSNLDYVDSLVGLNGGSNLSEVLANMQQSTNDSLSQLKEYLGTVQSNKDLFDKYTSTWEDMKKNIEREIEALEKAAKAMEENAKYSSNSSHSSSGSSGGGGSSSSSSGKGPNVNDHNYVNSGPGVELGDKGNSGSGTVKKYHSGVKAGYVGGSSSGKESQFAFVNQFLTKPLEETELPIIAQKGELVMTPEQQERMIENINELMSRQMSIKLNIPDFNKLAVNKTEVHEDNSINVGSVNIQEANNPNDLAEGIKKGIFKQLLKCQSKS